MNLNVTNIYIQYDNITVISLDYTDGDVVTDSVGANGIFRTLNLTNLSATDFGVIAVRDTDNSITSTYGMSTKDLAIIIVNLTAVLKDTSGLATGEEITGRLIPEVGVAGTFLISAPNSYEHRIVDL